MFDPSPKEKNDTSRHLIFALTLSLIGALMNLYPIELAFNISLLIGNAAYIFAASFVRPHITLICALITVTPLYFVWGHPFGYLTFGLEALFVALLRARGWFVITADLLYWLIIGMPMTALLVWLTMDKAEGYLLFTALKQGMNAVFYTSIAGIGLFLFSSSLDKIKPTPPALNKSLSIWLLKSFWTLSAFCVVLVSLILSTGFNQYLRVQNDERLALSNQFITNIANSYLKEHRLAIQNIANQLSREQNNNAQNQMLQQTHELYPGFITMLTTDAAGYINLAAPAKLIPEGEEGKLNVADREYFISAMTNQDVYISSVFRGRGFGDEPIVAISAPIYSNERNNQPTGIVEGSLNLGNFGHFKEQANPISDKKLILADEQGRVIYSSPGLSIKPLTPLSYDIPNEGEAIGLITLRVGSSAGMVFLHKKAKLENGWQVYSLLEHATVLKITEKLYLVMFITLFIVLFFASFFAMRFGDQLNKPLDFVLAILSKARKEADFKAIPEQTATEIKTLYQELKQSKLASLRSQNELEALVKERTKALDQANKQLSELASTDSLTKLHNRRYFSEKFSVLQSLLSRNESRLLFALIDLDHFKNINDSYGHLTGDQCLVIIAKMIKQTFNRDADIVARFGGEEFVVVTQSQNNEETSRMLENLRLDIANMQFATENGESVSVTISVGVAINHASFSGNESDWFSIADECLYRAKAEGRNRIIIKDADAPRSTQ